MVDWKWSLVISLQIKAACASFLADQPPSSLPRAQICDVIRARALHSCHDVTVGEILTVRIGEILTVRIGEIFAVRIGEIFPLKTA